MTQLIKFNQIYQSLMKAKTIDEIKDIRDKAEALRLYTKQQKQGLEMQNACAEIKLRAERRAGELLAEMERSPLSYGGDAKSVFRAEIPISEYANAIEQAQISRPTAHRWQLMAKLPEEIFEQEVQETKNSGIELTSSRMLQKSRRYIVTNNKTVPPTLTGKYRVIYADPPWKYNNNMPEYFYEQADHYPLMTIKEIAQIPIKDIVEDNSVLFLWVTSPILDECFEVVSAWGFKYKASFIWDKIKHNMGHYNSVRHEILLICTRGSCMPDVQKLFDSVQSIERSKHSEKPEEFRKIIDTIYPHGQRIELFARKKIDNWDTYGNERL